MTWSKVRIGDDLSILASNYIDLDVLSQNSLEIELVATTFLDCILTHLKTLIGVFTN